MSFGSVCTCSKRITHKTFGMWKFIEIKVRKAQFFCHADCGMASPWEAREEAFESTRVGPI